jgi:hypothetical protein
MAGYSDLAGIIEYMKGILFSIIGMSCHALMLSAQTCALSIILSPVVTYQLDIAGLEDIAWKAEPIDTNGDGKKDDGFIGVGQAQFSSAPNRQALIVRLNPNLTLYSADWPVTVGGNQNDEAY